MEENIAKTNIEITAEEIVTEKKTRDFKAVFLYLLFFALLVFAVSQKIYYHPNEFCAYILANKYVQRVSTPSGDSGYIFKGASQGASTIPGFMAVDQGHEFDLANAWHNMAYNESHPPLHGVLLHFTSSFCPGVASKWAGGVINIIFMLLILFAARKLMSVFTDNKKIITAISLTLICSSAMLNATDFFRMYVMAMFWITLNTYIFVRQTGRPATNKFCAEAFAVTFLGTMTHYYCAFYAVLLSCVYGVQLLCDKEFKSVFKFSLTQLASGSLFYAIYPRVTVHLFHDSRGIETIANASSGLSDTLIRLGRGWHIINGELFGWMLPVLAIALAILFYNYKTAPKLKKTAASSDDEITDKSLNIRRYALIFIPAFIYFLVVAKTAHIQKVDFFQEGFSRYFHPIYAVTLCGVLMFVFTTFEKYAKRELFKIALIGISALIILGSFICTDWKMDFLYRGYAQNQSLRDAYANAPCICFTGIGVNFCEAHELSGYRSLQWLPLNFDYSRLQNIDFGSQLVICIQSPGINTDITMNRIMPYLANRYNITFRVPLFLYWGGKGTVYYLDRSVR